jgi:hypothetical protein
VPSEEIITVLTLNLYDKLKKQNNAAISKVYYKELGSLSLPTLLCLIFVLLLVLIHHIIQNLCKKSNISHFFAHRNSPTHPTLITLSTDLCAPFHLGGIPEVGR